MSQASIVDAIIETHRSEIDDTRNSDDSFEVIVCDLLLREFNPSWDMIESGIVDGGADGGIDGIYVFLNGSPLLERTDVDDAQITKNAQVDIFFIQSKNQNHFKESLLVKLRSTFVDLAGLDADLSSKRKSYRDEIVDYFETINYLFSKIAGKSPAVSIQVVYACKGSLGELEKPKIKNDIVAIEQTLSERYYGAKVQFLGLGSSEIIDLYNRPAFSEKPITFSEAPTSPLRGGGWVGLVSLLELVNFCSIDGKLDDQMFEFNVRAFEGENKVNSAIRDTLESENIVDFWWLNNGVTVICDGVQPESSRRFHVRNAQIVNGQQTTTMIFKFAMSLDPKVRDERLSERHVLIRIIQTSDEEGRDKIVHATNFQTRIPEYNLRAMEDIHREIEIFLKNKGIFYDRKKNYYKGKGKKRSDIITIGELSQALMSVITGRPDTARGRPSDIISDEDQYKKLFDPKMDREVFYKVARAFKDIGVAFTNDEEIRPQRKNLLFHIMYCIFRLEAKKVEISASDVAKSDLNALIGHFPKAKQIVLQAFQEKGATDTAAKNRAMVIAIEEKIRDIVAPLEAD